ncbi:small acid-soluble spore protein Tlp [Pseudalkalibacillus hwajinpoensis]|uniref:small acid-soluble spore protein Tlp n=1 Tax=Guptibacillus hwajinpoensis TaxID=208199 RepID=UPI001CD58578|nr:small acid-soluble spore protein Tlp [Pseudalkalibacillus hwajinpoensis]MCA0990332.1 small acid-soluble spore protein Tlp [Pseudalkalibacillus hwajinpoensis]
MKSNPDDRRDNAEKLKNMVQDTIENIHDAEASLEFTDSDTQKKAIKEKNQRRKQSIESMRNEIKDESKQ